jgi:hypothetical protein
MFIICVRSGHCDLSSQASKDVSAPPRVCSQGYGMKVCSLSEGQPLSLQLAVDVHSVRMWIWQKKTGHGNVKCWCWDIVIFRPDALLCTPLQPALLQLWEFTLRLHNTPEVRSAPRRSFQPAKWSHIFLRTGDTEIVLFICICISTDRKWRRATILSVAAISRKKFPSGCALKAKLGINEQPSCYVSFA